MGSLSYQHESSFARVDTLREIMPKELVMNKAIMDRYQLFFGSLQDSTKISTSYYGNTTQNISLPSDTNQFIGDIDDSKRNLYKKSTFSKSPESPTSNPFFSSLIDRSTGSNAVYSGKQKDENVIFVNDSFTNKEEEEKSLLYIKTYHSNPEFQSMLKTANAMATKYSSNENVTAQLGALITKNKNTLKRNVFIHERGIVIIETPRHWWWSLTPRCLL